MTSPSRRDLLRAGGLSGLATLLSGCAGLFGDDPDTPAAGADAPRVDAVPAGTTAVVRADLAGMFADDALRREINDLVGTLGAGVPEVTVDGLLDWAQDRSDLDPRQVTELLALGSVDTGQGVLVVWTEFSEQAVADLLSGPRAETREYGGYTVYTADTGSQLAALGDGQFAIGTGPAVERVVDVRTGDIEPVAGDTRTAYASAESGYLRLGFDIPRGRLPAGGGPAAPVAGVEYGYGSFRRTEDSFTLSLSALAEDAESARALADQLRTGVDALRADLDRVDRPRLQDRLRRLLAATEVERDDRLVTAYNPDGGVALATVAAAVAATFVLGLGDEAARRPAVTVTADYDRTDTTLTLTHAGGDTVRADRLAVRGTGLNATGAWPALGGDASQTVDGRPAVRAGDALALAAAPDYRVRLVWTGPDGTEVVLAQSVGPDA